MTGHSIDRELEARVEELGFEVVELERTGSKNRPLLRLRIDRLDSEPGHGVTVDDCARVSRVLETYLDEAGVGDGRYTLEVSSPGVERPLNRARDFRRFAGQRVALRGYAPLAGRDKRLEGELLGLADAQDEEEAGGSIRIRLDDGEEAEIPREEVARAHLVFRWNAG
ncbi:MAG TPA: ribosome maturation factor RimP [Longimicrobiales bacterium]|nr:ribosome maturation factor RimP [Longimicrobiales bacterium]